MNAYLKNVTVGLIVLFLWFTSMFHFAYANKSSTQLGARYRAPEEEISADSNITNLIASYSSVAGYDVYNWYGSPTNSSNIYCAAEGAGAQYSITFYIGEGNSEYMWNWIGPIPFWEQQWFISDDNGNKVYDKDIFPYSDSQYLKFAFLWSCKQGDTVGGTHWSGTPFGMPYAWLHNASISDNGYINPDGGEQAFLGFAGVVYGLADFLVGDDLQKFLSKFYYSALCYGAMYSINDALDYAAKLTWDIASFEDSWLYKGYNWTYWDSQKGELVTDSGQMKVYGDGNMHIGNLCPAMKTGTNGYFYKPDVASALLKIELLFDNQNITGDQTGGTPPYGAISNYPDTIVNVYDATFISSHAGESEGYYNWNYMADINPDRYIDLFDAIWVSRNSGKNGTYITDLSGVTVLFNTGEEIWPDSDGFVTIPQGATSFTVKRYGNPIGAMIVFW